MTSSTSRMLSTMSSETPLLKKIAEEICGEESIQEQPTKQLRQQPGANMEEALAYCLNAGQNLKHLLK